MKFPEQFRVNNHQTKAGDPFGCFIIPSQYAKGRAMFTIASDGATTGWEHVSVSLIDWPKRCPSWDEMCIVKSLFWDDNTIAVQFHPAKADHVNMHQSTLHLWVCARAPIQTPPKICV